MGVIKSKGPAVSPAGKNRRFCLEGGGGGGGGGGVVVGEGGGGCACGDRDSVF